MSESRASVDALRPPRRSWVSIVVPLTVVAATAVLLAVSAWPTLQPARQVEAGQAIGFVAPTDEAAAPTVLHEVARRSTKAVQAAGWVEAEPHYIAISALADGVVKTIDVLEGDTVKAKQVVATLVPEDSQLRLELAKAELSAAKAARDTAKADLVAAEATWDDPVELEQATETAEAKLNEAKAELAQLPLLIEAAVATLVQLEADDERIARSHKRAAATDIEAIIAKQRMRSQAGTVKALEARKPILQAKVVERESNLKAAKRNLKLRIDQRRAVAGAKAELAQAEARVKHATAARDEAQLEFDRMVIRSPIDGYVQRRLKVPGDKVLMGMDSPHSAHLLHIYDPKKLQVRVDVALADVAHVYVGQKCEVVADVLPQTTFAGEVLRVTNEADLQKNTLEVKVKIIDPSPLLKPEMLARVKFIPGNGAQADVGSGDGDLAQSSQRLRIPTAALGSDGARSFVWTIRDRRGDRGSAQRVDVVRETRGEGYATVVGHLNHGELLVLSPNGLSEGDVVQFASSSDRSASEGGTQ